MDNPMFVENEHAMRLEVKISRDSGAGKKIVHRFVELNAQGRIPVIQKE